MNPPSSLPGRAVQVLRRRFPPLFGAAVWPYLVLASIFVVINVVVRHTHPASGNIDPAAAWRGMSILAKFGVIIGFVACASMPHGLAMGSVSSLAYEDYCGRESSLGSALKRVMGRLLSLVALSFLVGCGAVFGTFLFLLPGLMITMLTVFAIPVMLLEEAGVATALRRSMCLAWDRIGTVLGLLLSFALVFMVVEGIFSLLIGTLNLEGTAAAGTMWAFLVLGLATLVCVYGTAVTVLYYDIRVSRGELQAPNVMQ